MFDFNFDASDYWFLFVFYTQTGIWLYIVNKYPYLQLDPVLNFAVILIWSIAGTFALSFVGHPLHWYNIVFDVLSSAMIAWFKAPKV